MSRFVDSVRLVSAIPSFILFVSSLVTSGVYTVNYEQDRTFKELKYYNRLQYPIWFSIALNLTLTLLYFPILADMLRGKGLFLKVISILLVDVYILGLIL